MWIYKVVRFVSPDACEAELNRLGAQGWELVAVSGAYGNNFYFKKKA